MTGKSVAVAYRNQTAVNHGKCIKLQKDIVFECLWLYIRPLSFEYLLKLF